MTKTESCGTCVSVRYDTCVQVDRGGSDNTVPSDTYDNEQRGQHGLSSPQPVITLTDMSDSGQSSRRREQILYSEDFDAIHEYLQNTDSPMVNLSPSWLCRGTESSTVHVFPSTPVHHNSSPTSASVMHVGSDAPQTHVSSSTFSSQPATTSALPSTIDMSSSIGSSSLHDCEVCAHISLFLVVC